MLDDDLLGLAITTMASLAGMNQDELARGAKMSPSTVSNWNKGRKRPTPANLRRAAKAIGCPVDAIRYMAEEFRRQRQRIIHAPAREPGTGASGLTSKDQDIAEVSPLDDFSGDELFLELGRLVARQDRVIAEIRSRGLQT
jgi:transcriptional regulator with XRE-family HTH domain